MAKGDDFQFRVRPAPGVGRSAKEPIADMSAVESRENRDWRDCADQSGQVGNSAHPCSRRARSDVFIGSRIRLEDSAQVQLAEHDEEV